MPEQSAANPRVEFRRLKESGHRRSPGMAIGWGIARARDLVARPLIALGVTPNTLTILGFIASCIAGVCLLFGGGYTHAALREMGRPPYVLIAAFAVLFACAMDMLDGAVAKLGRKQTPLGAVLDSTIDRLSDAAIYVGLVGHFVLVGNLTYGVLAALALMDAMMISYVKARAECIIADCEVGYWARGERCVAFLIGTFFGAMPAMLWQQSISPGFTAVRRIIRFHRVLTAKAKGLPEPPDVPPHGLGAVLRPWRCPRGSIPYDVITSMNIVFVIVAARLHPFFGPDSDPLRAILNLPR